MPNFIIFVCNLGNYYKAEVTCVEGVCNAKNPYIDDSCHYICASPTCDHVNDVAHLACTAVYATGDCCSESNKCSVGRGDCDSDSHCQTGLKCGKDNCIKFSYDFPDLGYDCCYDPTNLECTGVYATGSCCSESNKCSVGRGDCDSDSHCQAGLKCGKDNCIKFSDDFPDSGYDCCYDPNAPKCGPGNADGACCSETNKCGEGLGDCDSDSQCEEGLKCGLDNCGTGFPTPTYDCCFKPTGK